MSSQSWYTTILNSIMQSHYPNHPTIISRARRRASGFRPNRVDAHPGLLRYYEAHPELLRDSDGDALKEDRVNTKEEEEDRRWRTTDLLPPRTTLRGNKNPLDDAQMAQTHAYYEEIVSVPAGAVGERSLFHVNDEVDQAEHEHDTRNIDNKAVATEASTSPITNATTTPSTTTTAKENSPEKPPRGGHWHIIHPLPPHLIRTLSTRVLHELRHWIESTGYVYIGTHPQVEAFKEKRGETLELVVKELERRRGGEVRDSVGYLGLWQELGGWDDEYQEGKNEEKDEGEKESGIEGKTAQQEQMVVSLTGNSEVDETVRRMVDELRDAEFERVELDVNSE